jgi:hypothetical protein
MCKKKNLRVQTASDNEAWSVEEFDFEKLLLIFEIQCKNGFFGTVPK